MTTLHIIGTGRTKRHSFWNGDETGSVSKSCWFTALSNHQHTKLYIFIDVISTHTYIMLYLHWCHITCFRVFNWLTKIDHFDLPASRLFSRFFDASPIAGRTHNRCGVSPPCLGGSDRCSSQPRCWRLQCIHVGRTIINHPLQFTIS